jgi:hypothetical protein
MSEVDRFSGVVTPPLSENGETDRCPISTVIAEEVNKDSTAASPFPPSPPSSIRVRRDRSSSQREAIRSKQFTTRVQRSDSTASNDPLGRKKPKGFTRQTTRLPVDHGLKAIEPPHEQTLTKMAFAEQQKWITVQQKTFTKWYDLEAVKLEDNVDFLSRLNTKIEPRGLAVVDLVKDLSDGVCIHGNQLQNVS